MHYWGDGFNFDRLNAAGKQIENIFKEISGKDLYWKEKYGTLRYEWFRNPGVKEEDIEKGIYRLEHVDYQNEDFLFSVLLTVVDYKDIAGEILSDFLFHSKWDEINQHRPKRQSDEFGLI
jgi:hypothetical protein